MSMYSCPKCNSDWTVTSSEGVVCSMCMVPWPSAYVEWVNQNTQTLTMNVPLHNWKAVLYKTVDESDEKDDACGGDA